MTCLICYDLNLIKRIHDNPSKNCSCSHNIVGAIMLLFSKLSLTTFVSIDCGSSESNTDIKTNITWTGDDAYIRHGKSHQIYLGSGPFNTLRVFPTRKKNCYSIGVQKGQKVLTRASFFYGSYDNKSFPPVFDLIFDGNYWATVNTSTVDYVDYEAIYVTKGNYTSICVAQTMPNHIPFISSLEVRSLDPAMYNHVDSNHALILIIRAFGANQTVRYPDDVFDRIWTGLSANEVISEVKSEALGIDISTVEDHPPQVAMQNAIATPNTSYHIEYNYVSLPLKELQIYINAYFSDVMKDAIGKRSIQTYVDNKPFSSPIVPPFGSAKEVYINMTVSSNISVAFQATPGSTLPPILNAKEFYKIDPLANGTDTRDVEGLRQLQLAFEMLVEWRGDPCLPFQYEWDWIKCTADAKPRVAALYLNGYNLHGVLPDFSSMDALEIIDLHNNTIEGHIPEFLGLLPKLRVLNLSYNGFNGSVPTSLIDTDIDIDTRSSYISEMHYQSINDSPKMSLKLHILLLVATQISQSVQLMNFL